jgi:hypothetical protein
MRMRSPPAAVSILIALAFALGAAPAARADWPAVGLGVAVAGGTQANPDAAADGEGGAYVVWEDSRAGYTDIWCQRLTRAGAPHPGWPAGGIGVCLADVAQVTPRVCIDGAGGALIVWCDQTGGQLQSDIYMQHVTGDGAIAAGWPAATSRGVIVCGAGRRQNAPVIVPDGSGGAFIAWSDNRWSASTPNVGFAHVLASGAYAPGWPGLGYDLFEETYAQQFPSLAVDGSGGCFIGFTDGQYFAVDPALNYEITLMRYSTDGNVLSGFAEQGNDLTGTRGSQSTPSLVSDGSGGVFVAWQDARNNPDIDIYATRIDGNGAVHAGYSLLATGLALSTAAGEQTAPRAVSDGAGGALVVWSDARTSPAFRLYASHATGTGTIAPGWPAASAGGLAICSVASDQQQPGVVSDGASGAIVAWRDGRNASTDIYATRVTGGGAVAPGWPADGVGVCTSAGAQSSPAIVSDGAGGAFVFWNDQRSDGGDIYGAHLTANGDPAPVAGVGPANVARFALRIASANPARGAVVLSLSLPARANVSAEVFDPAGRRVRTLLAGEPLEAGTRALAWDGRDDAGRALGAGLYFVAARAGGERSVVRIARAD